MRQRFTGLDGLRGIAALIVVFSHTWLIFQAWVGGPGPDRSAMVQAEPWAKALQQSPLALFYAGGEAVFVFFILSGFVLVLPFLRGRRTSWAAYYPKRVLRLYLPVVGAVVLAALVIMAVPRVVSADQTWWVNQHAAIVTPKGLLREAYALNGTGRYNSVLWTLKWEIIFSLLLPLFVIAVVWFRRWWLAGIAGMILLSFVGFTAGNGYLQYLPMFGIGAFLAAGKDQVIELSARWPLGAVSMGAAGVVLSLIWSAPDLDILRPLLLTACTALVIAFMVWEPALKISRSPVVVWLGSRSFSLYLVHEPIIVSAALIFPGAPWMAVAVAWPVALLITEAFFRLVEDPSRRTANWVGLVTERYAGRRRTPMPEASAAPPAP